MERKTCLGGSALLQDGPHGLGRGQREGLGRGFVRRRGAERPGGRRPATPARRTAPPPGTVLCAGRPPTRVMCQRTFFCGRKTNPQTLNGMRLDRHATQHILFVFSSELGVPIFFAASLQRGEGGKGGNGHTPVLRGLIVRRARGGRGGVPAQVEAAHKARQSPWQGAGGRGGGAAAVRGRLPGRPGAEGRGQGGLGQGPQTAGIQRGGIHTGGVLGNIEI